MDLSYTRTVDPVVAGSSSVGLAWQTLALFRNALQCGGLLLRSTES